MSAGSPPLRFLVLALGGWACFRAALLAPAWWDQSEAVPRRPQAVLRPLAPGPGPAAAARADAMALPRRASPRTAPRPPIPRAATAPTTTVAAASLPAATVPAILSSSPRTSPPAYAAPRQARRWSASAWLLTRRERGPSALAPGGTLGGSQAGGRLLYRLNRDPARPLAVSVRFYVPLRNAGESEAAVGLDWRPLQRLPVHLLAERRQALGRDGRSAFALAAYGGYSGRVAGGLLLDAYGQAGMVGLTSRDLFVDGSVRLGAPIGPVEVGAGAWGAAQPGAARLDLGPHVSMRLPAGGVQLRLIADWRFRVAGEAAPGSGPALTLATDF